MSGITSQDGARPASLHLPAFDNVAPRHGGVRRSSQLCELVEVAGGEVLPPPSRLTVLTALLSSPLSLLLVLPAALGLAVRMASLRGSLAALLYGAWLRAELKRRGWPRLGIEITPGRQLMLANMLVSLRIPFSAFPHNVEFLVPGQGHPLLRSDAAAFAAEARVYRHALAVHAISNFDAGVIRALGATDVDVIAYRPCSADLADLAAIRARRGGGRDGFVLILGTAGNPPTRRGMERLLDLISRDASGRRYVLAGFETECFAGKAPPSVEVRGGVHGPAFEQLLVACRALLVYQPPTSGMLTRLVDAGCAGIPAYVMGEYSQAAELAHEGVNSIETLDELPAAP